MIFPNSISSAAQFNNSTSFTLQQNLVLVARDPKIGQPNMETQEKHDSGPKANDNKEVEVEEKEEVTPEIEDKEEEEVGGKDEEEEAAEVAKEREEEEEKLSPSSKADFKMALSDDPTKVKFTRNNSEGGGNQNGEAKVDIENVQLAFAGMGKEELMQYADDPFWVKLRWSLFGLFWLLWAAMLVGAIIIVVTTPGCPPPPPRDWWQRGVVYQVYPKSFKDSDGDGIGDIKGIESELNYFKELGVNILWLNPVYKSPMEDGGYDISDFKSIDPTFGTMEDFKSLLKSAHENDMHVIMEYVPNHSSNQHEWFLKSRDRIDNYTDYYIWANGQPGSNDPPNNWKSVFGNSSWTYDRFRNQYYYHQFLSSQPDLNLRNPLVLEELEGILKFWLDIGVDGFRVDAVKHLYEDEDLPDEPLSSVGNPSDYRSLKHNYTAGLPENLDLLLEWRKVLKTYEDKDGKHRLMMVEVYDEIRNVMTYYGNETEPLADFPFNFVLLDLDENSSGANVSAAVSSWLEALPVGKWSNWVLGNHDVGRIASRTSPSLVDAYNIIIMLLGGTPVTYYGEEIGMVNVPLPFHLTRDKKGLNAGREKYAAKTRDFARTPMQWNAKPGAGFTNSSSPWLPISSDYESLNVQIQRSDAESHLEIYKKLTKLRKEPAFLYGKCHFPTISEEVFSFIRVKKGNPGYAIFVNFGKNATNINVNFEAEKMKLPEKGLVELRSGGNSTVSAPKSTIYFNNIALGPSEAVVINFVPKFDS